jgi:hypothetical protein
MSALLSQSGGLVYHFRAWRYHSTLWQPFRQELKTWLEQEWNPPKGQPLVLIGPSAGWCLPVQFLEKFPQVVAYDLDPFALFLLKKRMKGVNLSTVTSDALGVLDHPTGDSLRRLITSAPLQNASILFCNLWGQLYFDDELEKNLPAWRIELEKILAGRNWASFFDRLSGAVPPDIRSSTRDSSGSLSDAALLDTLYSASQGALQKPVELQDHSTGDYFAKNPRRHLSWELEPGRFHLIECIHA